VRAFLAFAFLLLLLSAPSPSFALTYEEIREAYYRSYMYEKAQDYEDAIKALMPIYEKFPNGYTVNLRLGWLYYLYGRYANSEYHYKKAIRAIPSSLEALLGLTLPYMAQGRWKEVEETCYKILRSDYYNYYANLRLSYALRNEKNYLAAENVARKMLAIYPTDVNFLLELAISLYLQGKLSFAEAIFKDVLILSPENPTAKKYLEMIERRKKD